MDNINQHIKSLRRDFIREKLDERDVNQDPFIQFGHWFRESISANVNESNAMIVSSVSPEGRPSSRVVLLREFSNEGLTFFTNYNSKKGRHFQTTPFASALFFWPELERQIAIEGSIERVRNEISDDYFNSRPKESRIGAWASEQSMVIKSRAELEKKVEEVTAKFSTIEPPRPLHWGGYRIIPDYFEFWQGRSNRLHDRICYRKTMTGWVINRLSP